VAVSSGLLSRYWVSILVRVCESAEPGRAKLLGAANAADKAFIQSVSFMGAWSIFKYILRYWYRTSIVFFVFIMLAKSKLEVMDPLLMVAEDKCRSERATDLSTNRAEPAMCIEARLQRRGIGQDSEQRGMRESEKSLFL
jgi:hypothetical protein